MCTAKGSKVTRFNELANNTATDEADGKIFLKDTLRKYGRHVHILVSPVLKDITVLILH